MLKEKEPTTAAGSDPIGDIETASETVRATAGRRPNRILIFSATQEQAKDLKEFHFPETGVTILAESREEAEKQLKK